MIALIAVAAVFVVGLVLGTLAGIHLAAKQELWQAMREAGLTKESVRLYGRAAKILRRLDGLTDLDGDLAADILTPTTRKQVSEWLADYRKGLDQK